MKWKVTNETRSNKKRLEIKNQNKNERNRGFDKVKDVNGRQFSVCKFREKAHWQLKWKCE